MVVGVTAGDLAADYVPDVAKAIVIIVATWILAHLARRVIAKRVPGNYQRQLSYALPKVVWVFGIIVLLSSLGINISSLLAVLGILGLAGALVFTPVGQNLIAGFLAGMDDVVQNGDEIDVGDRTGKVVRKGMLSLGVELPDGSLVYMPNTKGHRR